MQIMGADEPVVCQRTFTILPIDGKEVIQKNFALYGQDGDQAAADFIQAKKLTLARRFQLMERGYVLQLKEDNRVSLFDQVDVKIAFGSVAKNRTAEGKNCINKAEASSPSSHKKKSPSTGNNDSGVMVSA